MSQIRPQTVGELGAWLNAPQNSFSKISGFSVDSRTILPGEVYFALPGSKVDGHTFLSEVAKKGSVVSIVNDSYSGPDFGMHLIYVKDVLKSLQDLAKKTLQNVKSLKTIGVTGSVGKTTTKDFTTTLLSEKYSTLSNLGNQNSQVGLALTLLNRLQSELQAMVLEMSMTHKGNLARLVEIAPPDVAVITEVALVHAVNFPNIEAIAEAKAEIFLSPKTTLGLVPYHVVHKDTVLKTGHFKKWTFSTVSEKADLFLQVKEEKLVVKHLGEVGVLSKPNIPGAHNLHNLLAAIGVARAYELSWEEIESGIRKLQLPDKRLQFIEKEGVLFLNDSYNASLLSVKAALQTLPKPRQGGKKIAVLGEMLELGKFSEECHKEVAEFAMKHVDEIFCIGEKTTIIHDVWKKNGLPIQQFSSRDNLSRALKASLKPNDVVLLKGSRAFELWKVLDEI